jgi:hypothetical protein
MHTFVCFSLIGLRTQKICLFCGCYLILVSINLIILSQDKFQFSHIYPTSLRIVLIISSTKAAMVDSIMHIMLSCFLPTLEPIIELGLNVGFMNCFDYICSSPAALSMSLPPELAGAIPLIDRFQVLSLCELSPN